MKIRRVCPHTLREKWNVSAGAWWGGAHLGRLASAADLKTIEFLICWGTRRATAADHGSARPPGKKKKRKINRTQIAATISVCLRPPPKQGLTSHTAEACHVTRYSSHVWQRAETYADCGRDLLFYLSFFFSFSCGACAAVICRRPPSVCPSR